jgi:hypothetical protein
MGKNKGTAGVRSAADARVGSPSTEGAEEATDAQGAERRGVRSQDPGALKEVDGNGLSGAIPDLFRRAMALGLSGFFTTEETIRKALGDTLPQDWIDFATAQSERTRTELMQRMTEEIGRVMERVELAELLERLLEGRTIEVTAQIRLGDQREQSDTERPAEDKATTVRVEVAGGEKSET